MSTGLYFGSFNPIHIGHLAIANYMVEFGGINELWFVVSPHNPLKEKSTLLPDYQRLEIVNRAIGNYPKLKASNIEFTLPKPSYTVDTLAYLDEKHPQKKFSLIMGEDNLQSFAKWKNHKHIIDNRNILVYPRPNCKITTWHQHKNVKIIKAPHMEISSSFIRKAISQDKDVRFFVPDEAWKYIDEMNFYKSK